MRDTDLVSLEPARKEGVADTVLATQSIAMSAQEAVDAVLQHYRLGAVANPLRSERDQNFQIQVGGVSQYVLKLANAAEPESLVDFKIAALKHVAAKDPSLPVQRVVQTEDGLSHFGWRAADGRLRLGYMLTFLPGIPMSSCPRSVGQSRSLGILAARLGNALSDFSHPAAGHELLWDLKHAATLRRYLDQTRIELHRDLAARALDRFEEVALPRLATLRSQVIHNDLNLHNVLINEDNSDRASGIIDFGDMVHGALVNDVAVTCAYLFGTAPDPLAPLCDFLSSYGSVIPLQEEEVRMLPELIAARLATTIVITNWRASQYPENKDYIMRNQNGAIAALQVLSSLSPGEAQDRFWHAASGRS